MSPGVVLTFEALEKSLVISKPLGPEQVLSQDLRVAGIVKSGYGKGQGLSPGHRMNCRYTEELSTD